MKIEDLIASLPSNYTGADIELIQRAYRFAEIAHNGQQRISGEAYITHCLSVASILAELSAQPAVVAAGLLHDVISDTPATLEDIQREFGDEIAGLVNGITKLTNLPYTSRADQHPSEAETFTEGEALSDEKNGIPHDRRRETRIENLRKTFIAMSDDIRIVIIKLADRLHNMRTLGYLPEPQRKRIAQETLDLYAPLANRLGIWRIKWELEDLSFRYINPEKYREIAENLSERHADREAQIQQILERLKTIMEQAGIQAEISGRPKHIYSIYKKMIEKGKQFDMVRDVRGVRLIVQDIPSCYAALGIIHTHWRPIPNEFDDYIAAPKDNFYQSLHTAVIYDDGKPLEVQIRTTEMHRNAEYGIAAHWRYKEKSKHDQAYDQRINWLRRLMEWRQEALDAQEFVEGVKSDIFEDRVYVFSPKGDIYDLPAGSTPIDFAYHVHTEIGHRCRGAKVNNKLVSLDYVLKTGDQVTILTAKHGGPSRDWLNPNLGLVKTQRARSKIQQWFKRQDREQNLTQGKLMLERELRRLGMSDINLDELAKSLEYRTVDDLYVALGCGDISAARITNRLSELEKTQTDPLLAPRPSQEVIDSTDTVSVRGLKGILTSMARCCNPTPGDEIVGYITRGRGATIHRSDCPNILRLPNNERILKVTWGEPRQTYPVNIEIKAYDRQGLIADISGILSSEGINLLDIKFKVSQSYAYMNLVIEVHNVSQLSRVLTRIENLPNVMEAYRVKPG